MSTKKHSIARDVYIIEGTRTPFLKARGRPGPFSASDLAVSAARHLIAQTRIEPRAIDEVITGCVMPSADEANISRLITLRLGCGNMTPAWTVQRNCASGLQAIDAAAQSIATGRSDLVLAGGTEAMSRAPLLFNDDMVDWLGSWYGAKTIKTKLALLTKIRPKFFAPVIALMKGLNDPLINMSMGQTAEKLAYRFNIDRVRMDEYSVRSHHLTAHATDNNFFSGLVSLYDYCGNYYSYDDGLRRDSSIDNLAKLKPFFDKKFGSVTAGNSSQITDGAAYVLLASKEAVKKYNLNVIARIIDTHWVALDPTEMGLGPTHAISKLLTANNMTLEDVDYYEINEAFAAQVIACLEAWKDSDYCKNELGLSKAFGELDMSILNIDGGAIAIGHPVGASGARLVVHLSHILNRKKAKYGIASLCIGGGQGGAMLIERVTKLKDN